MGRLCTHCSARISCSLVRAYLLLPFSLPFPRPCPSPLPRIHASNGVSTLPALGKNTFSITPRQHSKRPPSAVHRRTRELPHSAVSLALASLPCLNYSFGQVTTSTTTTTITTTSNSILRIIARTHASCS